MLYDSTKTLLRTILQSLERADQAWDDHVESSKACLYEMHQMSRPLYKAYRSDSPTASSPSQSSLPVKLNLAMPHVRSMVIAIRHKDRTTAIQSGKAALAEMNGKSLPIRSASAEPQIEASKASNDVRPHVNPNGKHHRTEPARRPARSLRASAGQ